jgi:hypothetical protein
MSFPHSKESTIYQQYQSAYLPSNSHHSFLSYHLHTSPIHQPPTPKMPRSLSLSTLLLVALAFASNVAAVPTAETYPEVIPGPGIPSLASLGLTSADLYKMDHRSLNLGIRQDPFVNCDGQKCQATDSAACVNYLASLGNQLCNGTFDSEHELVLCTSGSARLLVY